MACYIGIDIGGTNIKTGITDENGKLLAEAAFPAVFGEEEVVRGIASSVDEALAKAGLKRSDAAAAGVGSPGAVLPEEGVIIYNNNLGWRGFKLGPRLSEALGLSVRVENDANAAALAEVCAGSAKGASSAVTVTLGTGVGAGIVIDGKIWTGHNSAASEFGHMVIEYGGRQCTCGRRGCIEAYASATGLIAMTKEEAEAHPESSMNAIIKRDGSVGGHTAFEAADGGDAAAAEVIDRYISYLACGLTNIVNGLRPEVISIGGGVGKQGERLLTPLREKIAAEAYGASFGISIPRIVSCALGYEAGIVGAAMAARLAF